MNNEEYEYAGFWIRFVACLIDMLLLVLLMAIIKFLLLTMMIYVDSIGETLLIFIISYIFPFFATILFWFYKSATPGKMALNIKIVSASNGSKLSVGQCIGRFFAYIPAVLVFLIGIIWIAFDKRKQGWHDKLAGTVVIRKKKGEKVEFKT